MLPVALQLFVLSRNIHESSDSDYLLFRPFHTKKQSNIIKLIHGTALIFGSGSPFMSNKTQLYALFLQTDQLPSQLTTIQC